MLLTKKFKFEAAHNILNYEGDCKKLHGHSYALEITVKGEVSKDGFVIDFKEIDEIVKEKVLKVLDHSYLNDVVKVSTCENLVKWIWEKLAELNLYEIKLYETSDSWVAYRGE